MNRQRKTDPRAPALIALLAALLFTTGAWALPEDREQPIHVESDRAERDGSRGTTLYEGDVRLTQGTLHIRADRLEVHTDENNEVRRVIAEGRPAHFEQQPEADDELVEAEANTIDYDVAGETLELVTDALLKQGDARMTGNRIDYDIADEIMKARGESGTDRPRIEMVLPPRGERPQQD